MIFAWLLLAYLVAFALGGTGGILTLLAIGVLGTVVMLGAEALHAWRADRAERRAVYRRWSQWELEAFLRRHGWRS